MKLVKLTNRRPAKVETAEVIASPTKGNIKLTVLACTILGVIAGDRVEVAKDEEGQLFIFPSTNEEDNLGQKLASTSKTGGGNLSFSSANAWIEMDGDTEHNTHYTLGTPVDVEGNEWDDEISEGTKYVPMVFKEKVVKQLRKSGEDTASDEEEIVYGYQA